MKLSVLFFGRESIVVINKLYNASLLLAALRQLFVITCHNSRIFEHLEKLISVIFMQLSFSFKLKSRCLIQ